MALTKVTGHVVLPTTNIEFHNTKSTGIVTFTHTSNATSSTTGALQITGGVGIVKDLHVGGNITVGGTLTYDDVTNIDSLGIITARGGIHVGPPNAGVATVSSNGSASFTGIVTTSSTLFAKEFSTSGIGTFADINVKNPGDTRITSIAPGALILSRTSPVIYLKDNLSDTFDASIELQSNELRFRGGGNSATSIRMQTTSSGVSFPQDIDVDGHTNLDNVSISGVSTFRDDVDFVGDPVGIAQTSIQFHKGNGTDADLDNLRFYDSASASFGVGHTGGFTMRGNYNGAGPTYNSFILARGNNFFIDGGTSTSIVTRTQFGRNAIVANSDNGGSGTVELYHSSGGTATKRLETSGIGVTITNQLDTTNIVASGVITATTVLNSPLLGVGTNNPANDIQVRKTGNAEIQVTSDTGSAGITVGRESGTANTNNAEFRYGLVSGGSPNSSAQSLDILNYGTENFNYHLSAANANTVNGNFHWHKGPNTTLMTLTGIGGSLGIATKDPITPLHVQGAGTITGSLTVGNNLSVGGNLILESAISGNLTGNVTGNVTGDINSSATSTFNNTNATGVSTFTSIYSLTNIGIAVPPSLPLSVNTNASNRFFVNGNGNVGIKTTDSAGNTLLVAGSIVGQIIGAGTTQPLSTVDFSLAGQGLGGAFTNKMFMIPPKVTNAQRGNLAGLVSGAMIYNTDLNKLQVYNGTAWETVTSS